ncbi:DUF4087 domain-containing protein [Desulfonatronum lacustre]|uniref:DUF4087 domain-containing protein n=1 Tax=Desulfonatronum lacustre TaxID=66849 RepID=UPI0012EB3F73
MSASSSILETARLHWERTFTACRFRHSGLGGPSLSYELSFDRPNGGDQTFGYQLDQDWDWPEFAPSQWVTTNVGSYGYGCLDMEFEANLQGEVTAIISLTPLFLQDCPLALPNGFHFS